MTYIIMAYIVMASFNCLDQGTFMTISRNQGDIASKLIFSGVDFFRCAASNGGAFQVISSTLLLI